MDNVPRVARAARVVRAGAPGTSIALAPSMQTTDLVTQTNKLAAPEEERPPKNGSEALMYATPFLALSVAGLGLAGLFDRGPAFLRQRPLVSGLLALGGAAALFKTQFDRFLVESPEYESLGQINGLELRIYAPRVVAETVVEASSFDVAREVGFKRLADYIFGNNEASERFAMTTPVSLGRAEQSNERLPMTTPVTLSGTPSGHVMRFNMPKGRPLTSLPRPVDPRVSLRWLPEEDVAVLRFRGTYSGAHIAKKQRELLERVKEAGYEAKGEPFFAGYDSPAALPLLRRVEVWVYVG
jgi:hypothetical protein